MDVDSSLSQLEKLIAEEAPMGPLVVGGFSQGGAMAQEMLQLPLADRIVGIVALGTRLVRPMELRLRLEELDKKGCSGCMASRCTGANRRWLGRCSFVRSSGWSVELVEHQKGHMIPTEHHDVLKDWLDDFVN